MSMEFPLLNILAAPLFSFGPALGTGLARVFIMSSNIALLLINYQIWRSLRTPPSHAASSWLLMPLMGLGLVYFPRFIPDVFAMLLVLAALGFMLREKIPRSAALWLSLGLLIKPTSIIVLVLLFLDPKPWQRLWRTLPYYGPAILLTAGYYLKINTWIQDLAGGGISLYRVDPQPPLQALREFFAAKKAIWNLFLQGLGFWGALPLLLLLSFHPSVRPLLKLWLILLLQLLVIAALDGAHAFLHQYYFIGMMPTVCLLVGAIGCDLPRAGRAALARPLLMILGSGSAISAMAYELRPLWVPTQAERFLDFQQCQSLKQQLQDWPWQTGYIFRSADRPYPLVGLCFGERIGSTRAKYGLYLKTDQKPADCHIVAQTEQLVGVQCSG